MTTESGIESTHGVQKNLWQVLGPGMLYAATAIGVSHLVQATRAGASFGLGLVVIVLAACLVKYPTMRFGSDFAAATGQSLIAGYRRQGWLAFGIYACAQILSMVFATAAVSLLTLGLFQAALGFEIGIVAGASILLLVVVTMLLTGGYQFLEKITKHMVALLTLLILAATVLIVPEVDWSMSELAPPEFSIATAMFVVALIGFMPTPSEGAVSQSLWTCAKAEIEGRLPSKADSTLDFNVGYFGSVLLALCFIILGAGVLYKSGVEFASSPAGFAAQLMHLFTSSVGQWAFPLIALTAITVIFSTLITGLDALTRTFVGIVEEGAYGGQLGRESKQRLHFLSMIGICIGAVLVLATLLTSFTAFIDMVTVLAFIISPLMAFLNHRVVTHELMPIDDRPNLLLRVWSILSILLLVSLTLAYLYLRIV